MHRCDIIQDSSGSIESKVGEFKVFDFTIGFEEVGHYHLSNMNGSAFFEIIRGEFTTG
jgi:hypothetical protein